MTEDEEFRLFAKALVNFNGDAFAAAKHVFPGNIGKAIRAHSEWVNRPEVIALQDEIQRRADENDLPTKTEIARELFDIGRSGAVEARDRINALKLYAELLGMLPKGGESTTNNNVTVNRVMVVPVFDSAEQWEESLRAQQAKLINASQG